MLAYDLIEIAERLNLITQRMIRPIADREDLPECFRHDARMLIERTEILMEQISDMPDLDTLHNGLQDFGAEIDRFIKALVIP